jgi:hypothetical protein
MSIEQIESEIVRGEPTIGPLLKQAEKRLEFFRFPMNHTGETKQKHDHQLWAKVATPVGEGARD